MPQTPSPAPDDPATHVRAALREAIGPHHDQASNSNLSRLLAPDLTLPEYDRILIRFHALHAFLAEHAPPQRLSPWNRLYAAALRTTELERDLDVRGLKPSAVARKRAQDAFAFCRGDDLADAITWAGRTYVMAGSFLGGRVIGRAVRLSLQLDQTCGSSFFSVAKDSAGVAEACFDTLERTPWQDSELSRLCEVAARFMAAHAAYWRMDEPT